MTKVNGVTIDASNAVLGRLASNVAKRLLKGEQIDIVNAEKAVITGSGESVQEKYETKFGLVRKSNPRRGPKFSRMPHMIVKLTIRGMLPWKQPTGRNAFKKLRVHIGVPEELSGTQAERVREAEHTKEKDFVVVEQVSRKLGAKW